MSLFQSMLGMVKSSVFIFILLSCHYCAAESAIKTLLCLLVNVHNLFQAVTVLLASSDQNPLDVNVFLTNSAILITLTSPTQKHSSTTVWCCPWKWMCEVLVSFAAVAQSFQTQSRVLWRFTWLDDWRYLKRLFLSSQTFLYKEFYHTIIHWWKKYFVTSVEHAWATHVPKGTLSIL